jgi:transcriptional regulator with XRE-family HTH domain
MQESTVPLPNPIRAVRLAQGKRLRETARRIPMDPGQLSKIERGEAGLTLEALAGIARVLELRDLYRHLAPFVREDR